MDEETTKKLEYSVDLVNRTLNNNEIITVDKQNLISDSYILNENVHYEFFEKLKSELKEELNITADNIMDKSLKISHYYQKYLNIYLKYIDKCKNFFIERDRIYSILYNFYSKNFKYKLSTKGEIESYIFGNKNYIDISRSCNTFDNFVKFLEKTLDNIKNSNFSIKNYIEYRKFINGV